MASADRPFHCPVCRRRFSSRFSLKRHLDEHTPDPRCQKCGKQLRPHESHYWGCP